MAKFIKYFLINQEGSVASVNGARVKLVKAEF